MKGKLILFSLILVMLGCSDKNEQIDTKPSSNSVLPIKISDAFGEFQTIKYNGNKIVSIISDTDPKHRTVFTYEGDYIINTKEYVNNILSINRNYTYSNGKLVKISSIDGSFLDYDLTRVSYTTTDISYTYINANLIEAIKTSAGEDYQYIVNLEYKLNTDGVVESFSGLGKELREGKSTDYVESGMVTYDDKNATFSNVLGFNKLILYDDKHISNIKHNILVYKHIIKQKLSNGTIEEYGSTDHYKVTYSYNKDNYPIMETLRRYDYEGKPYINDSYTVFFEYNK